MATFAGEQSCEAQETDVLDRASLVWLAHFLQRGADHCAVPFGDERGVAGIVEVLGPLADGLLGLRYDSGRERRCQALMARQLDFEFGQRWDVLPHLRG